MRKKLEMMKRAEKAAIEAALAASIKQLGNDANHFISSLMTQRERFTVGRRVLIANLILAGYTQMEINNRLSVSPNTYTKIRRWLDEELPNFETTNEVERSRLNAKNKAKTQYLGPLTFKALEKKYPMHFLLFNISKELIDNLKT
jgi:Trp operon repressor